MREVTETNGELWGSRRVCASITSLPLRSQRVREMIGCFALAFSSSILSPFHSAAGWYWWMLTYSPEPQAADGAQRGSSWTDLCLASSGWSFAQQAVISLHLSPPCSRMLFVNLLSYRFLYSRKCLLETQQWSANILNLFLEGGWVSSDAASWIMCSVQFTWKSQVRLKLERLYEKGGLWSIV